MSKADDLARAIQNRRDKLRAVLPSHISVERFTRIAISALLKTPDLVECTPLSFFYCLDKAAEFGLEIGRHTHLIPRRKKVGNGWIRECTIIHDYKGLVALAMRTGGVAYVHADLVRERDRWKIGIEGSDFVVRHEILEPEHEARGEVLFGYSMVRFTNGAVSYHWMPKSDIEKAREASPAKDDGPWVAWPIPMMKKTVFRQHANWIDLSPEFRDALEMDADELVATEVETIERPASRNVPLAALQENDPALEAIGKEEPGEVTTAPPREPPPSAAEKARDVGAQGNLTPEMQKIVEKENPFESAAEPRKKK